MGYVFDFHDAKACEARQASGRNLFAMDLEKRLMGSLLRPARQETVLDIGCGIGESLAALLDMGLKVTGLDPSPYMLDIAQERFQQRVDFHRGVAEDLPFEDNSFHHACFFTSLEFVDNPRRAIAEAARVAKDRIFIGVLNRYALKSLQHRVRGMFTESIYNRARFYSIWELKQLVRSLLGPVPITWRTVCHTPLHSGIIARVIENSGLVQRLPFGAFAGMVVTLVPRYRTRPLTIKNRAQSPAGAMSGCVGSARCRPREMLPENNSGNPPGS
ncbi:MAG: class I SAM-dependent methyltransferase [Thermodesulfobacteriota bacterium]